MFSNAWLALLQDLISLRFTGESSFVSGFVGVVQPFAVLHLEERAVKLILSYDWYTLRSHVVFSFTY